MKPIFLVLLVATSVFAVPVVVNEYSANEIPRDADDGRVGSLVSRAFDLIDGGDVNISILNVWEIIKDYANQNNAQSQSKALAQALGTLLLLSTGVAGDTCASANLINEYTAAARAGNTAAIRNTLVNYVSYVGSKFYLINDLGRNPESLRNAVGPTIGCAGAGRTYDFEGAWAAIRADDNSDLTNEEYCAAKRLYSALSNRSNNIGTIVTALSLPPVVRVFSEASGPIQALLRNAGNGYDASGAVNAVRGALVDAANRIPL